MGDARSSLAQFAGRIADSLAEAEKAGLRVDEARGVHTRLLKKLQEVDSDYEKGDIAAANGGLLEAVGIYEELERQAREAQEVLDFSRNPSDAFAEIDFLLDKGKKEIAPGMLRLLSNAVAELALAAYYEARHDSRPLELEDGVLKALASPEPEPATTPATPEPPPPAEKPRRPRRRSPDPASAGQRAVRRFEIRWE